MHILFFTFLLFSFLKISIDQNTRTCLFMCNINSREYFKVKKLVRRQHVYCTEGMRILINCIYVNIGT